MEPTMTEDDVKRIAKAVFAEHLESCKARIGELSSPLMLEEVRGNYIVPQADMQRINDVIREARTTAENVNDKQDGYAVACALDSMSVMLDRVRETLQRAPISSYEYSTAGHIADVIHTVRDIEGSRWRAQLSAARAEHQLQVNDLKAEIASMQGLANARDALEKENARLKETIHKLTPSTDLLLDDPRIFHCRDCHRKLEVAFVRCDRCMSGARHGEASEPSGRVVAAINAAVVTAPDAASIPYQFMGGGTADVAKTPKDLIAGIDISSSLTHHGAPPQGTVINAEDRIDDVIRTGSNFRQTAVAMIAGKIRTSEVAVPREVIGKLITMRDDAHLLAKQLEELQRIDDEFKREANARMEERGQKITQIQQAWIADTERMDDQREVIIALLASVLGIDRTPHRRIVERALHVIGIKGYTNDAQALDTLRTLWPSVVEDVLGDADLDGTPLVHMALLAFHSAMQRATGLRQSVRLVLLEQGAGERLAPKLAPGERCTIGKLAVEVAL